MVLDTRLKLLQTEVSGTAPWQLPSLHCKLPLSAIQKLGMVVVALGMSMQELPTDTPRG